jgi:biotin carboxyl carrier protein
MAISGYPLTVQPQREELQPKSHLELDAEPTKLHSTQRSRRYLAIAAAIVLLLCGIGLTEATGVTQLVPTVIRIVRGDGTLVLEVSDPQVQVAVDGEEVVITGAGAHEIRLRPGQHQVQATKDSKPIYREFVTITRGDKQVVKVALEPSKAPGVTGQTPEEAEFRRAVGIGPNKAPRLVGQAQSEDNPLTSAEPDATVELVKLRSPEITYLKGVYVKEGDFVKAGQVLAVLGGTTITGVEGGKLKGDEIELRAPCDAKVVKVHGQDRPPPIAFGQGSVVVELRPVQNSPTQRTSKGTGNEPSAITWGETRDGWQVGVFWCQQGEGEVAFTVKVRNVVNRLTTVPLKKPEGFRLSMSEDFKLGVHIIGGEQRTITLAPGEEQSIRVPNPVLPTEELPSGFYHVKFSTPIGDEDDQPPELGLQIAGEQGEPNRAMDSRDLHPELKSVAWGKPVLGLQAGIRFHLDKSTYALRKEINAHFYLRNISTRDIEIEYISSGTDNDWGPVVTDQRGKPLRDFMLPSGLKTDLKKTLKPGEAALLGHPHFMVEPQSDLLGFSTPVVYGRPGGYRYSTSFNLTRTDLPHLNLRLQTGQLNLEITAVAVEPEKGVKPDN